MGNSGSTHNLAHLDMGQMSNGPWMDPHGYRENRDPYHQLIKVLPDVSGEARLRATTNGNILHGGGTISGRREPPFGVYRSKSIHQMHRSTTQLNLRDSQPVLRRQSSEINFKRSGSEPDLRHRENNSMMQPPPPPEKDPKSMSHRAKIMRGKKKKAAPPPPVPQQQRMPMPLVTKDYDPSRFGWKQPHAQKPPTPPSKEARKLRLFKTKAESKRPPPSLLPSESSDRSGQSGRGNMPPIKNTTPTNAKASVKPVKEATTKWQEAKNRFFPLPQFRREKSFDITLLNANQQRTQQRVVDVMLHQPSTPSVMKKHATDDRPVRHSAIESKLKSKKMTHSQQVMDHERRGYGSADEGRSSSGKPDFKKELERATKRRSANLEPIIKSNRISETPSPATSSLSTHSRPIPRIRTSNEPIPKMDYVDAKVEITGESKTKSDSSVHSNHSNTKVNKPEPEPVKSKPSEEKPKSISPKVEKRPSVEKKDQDPKIVAELTKTFYFGMVDGYDEKIIQPHTKDDAAFDQIQVDAIDKFAETLHQNLKQTAKKNYSDSSESVLSSVVFDDEYTIRLNDDLARYESNRTSDDDAAANIQVNLRPTLPRRQYDIPRFSPSAAWRTLEISLDNQKLDAKSSTNTSLSNLRGDESAQASSPEQPHRQLEERIQRVYREPVPGFSDNKSGDSGISGDAGLPDRPESSSRPYSQRQLQADDETRNKVGPFLTPWTPQQDLNDDSSSDGGAADIKDEPSKLSNCGHIFSLSLPRESHFAAYGAGPMTESYYPPKHTFNSLQKTKPSLANVFGLEENDGVPFDNKLSVFRNDNWLLSRSAPNSIDNFNMGTDKGVNDETNSYKQTSRRESNQNSPTDYVTSLQMDIQPSSFNYITSGKHMMYLPKIAVNSINGESEHSAMNGNDGDLPEHIKKTLQRKYSPNVDSSRQLKNDSEHSTDSQSNNVSKFIIKFSGFRCSIFSLFAIGIVGKSAAEIIERPLASFHFPKYGATS